VLDPFAVLGLPPTASLAEVRAARRRLAKELHPDHGGDESAMRELNRAFDLAVKAILQTARPGETGGAAERAPEPPVADPPPRMRRSGRWVEQDAPSFSIDVLPAEAFEALLVVATWAGEVLVDDPPYLLEVHLYEPADCWCRLDLLPEAGATMVTVTVAGVGRVPPPPVDDVRDLWVTMLNQLGREP
jgi:hypothetical protein